MYANRTKPRIKTDTASHLRMLESTPAQVCATVIERMDEWGVCFVTTDAGMHVGFVKAKTDPEVWSALCQGTRVTFTYGAQEGASALKIIEEHV